MVGSLTRYNAIALFTDTTLHDFVFIRYISGAGDPRTKVHLVMGKSDPENPNKYAQQSIVIVPVDTPGVKVIRPMRVFGYDDAPEGHCEVVYDNVRVPLSNLVLGWGRGFEVSEVLFKALSFAYHAYFTRLFKVVLGKWLLKV